VIGEPPNALALRVEDFHGDLFFFRRLALQAVVKNCALGRVVSDRALAIDFVGEMQTNRGGRPIQMEVLVGNVGIRLPQWRDIVQNPKRAAMRRGNKVIVFDRQVVNGGRRQIELERLPMGAVIDGVINAGLGPGIEQSL
jgi:hypothetical protein